MGQASILGTAPANQAPAPESRRPVPDPSRKPYNLAATHNEISPTVQGMRYLKDSEKRSNGINGIGEDDDEDEVELQYNSLYDFGHKNGINKSGPTQSEENDKHYEEDDDSEVELQYNSLYDFGSSANKGGQTHSEGSTKQYDEDGDSEVELQYNSLYDFGNRR